MRTCNRILAAAALLALLAATAACAPTLADLRDGASDLGREDALRLAADAWDAWHAAELARDPTPANADRLEALDREWSDLYRIAAEASGAAWEPAIRDVVLFLRSRGAL